MALQQVHGTAVAIDDAGILLTGESGRGKSDLALRLITEGASLVADDRVDLTAHEGTVYAASPSILRNRLEVRGLGIIPLQALDRAPLVCVIDLVPSGQETRLPEPETTALLGISLPVFRLPALEASSVAKVQLAVSIATGSIMPLPTDLSLG